MAENEKDREATVRGGVEESAAPERKCAWETVLDPEYQCREPVGEVGQLCILHSGDAEKNRKEFHARVEKKKREGDFDFRGTFFPEAVWFTGELKQANFFEARFQGEANFSGARFQGDANFREATFQGKAAFFKATFQGEAAFFKATFQGKADFSDATFQGKADFFKATFQGAADFSDARFQGAADFWEARFQGEAVFRSSRFETEARFRVTRFRKEVSFLGCRFAGKAYLEWIRLSSTVEFKEAEFGSAVFFRGPFYAAPTDEEEEEEKERGVAKRQPIPPKLRFENVLLEEPEKARFEGLDLRETTFGGTNVRGIDFHDVTWARTLWGRRLRMSLADEQSSEARPGWRTRVAKLLYRVRVFLSHRTTADEWSGTGVEQARLVCRDLKASLEDQRDYADAGDFYYAEMELRRRQPGWIRGSLLWLYWLVCGYGEKPLRALVVFVCFWMLLAGIFTQTWFVAEQRVPWRAAEYDAQPKQGFHPYCNEALNHGLRSLTLQQRGGYLEAHSPWAIRLTLAANLLGPVQLGLFFLAMRRRFRR